MGELSWIGRLEAWLSTGRWSVARVEPLSGDVSTRRYARLHLADDTRCVAVVYPDPPSAVQVRFGAAVELLVRAGVRVPEILADDRAAGIMLVEDLGSATLYERTDLDWEARRPFYEAALEAARRIAGIPLAEVEALGSPPLDATLLERELESTVSDFLRPRGLAPKALLAALSELCARLAAAPRAACHRDYMARNLMPVGPRAVAVIDFQDLRVGPATYDLASLLNDSLFAPESLEAGWLRTWLPPGCHLDDYARAVAQRTLKAVGTFVRFARAGNPRHLPLVAPCLERAGRHLARLPETAPAFAPVETAWQATVRAPGLC